MYRGIILSSTLLLEMNQACMEQTTKSASTSTSDNKNKNDTLMIIMDPSHIKSLCQITRQCILLLQRLSQIIYLATNDDISASSSSSSSSSTNKKKRQHDNDQIQQQQQRHQLYKIIIAMKPPHNNHNDSSPSSSPTISYPPPPPPTFSILDWHDTLLPKSQHPLLQESFERNQLIDVETGVVFGHEDRLVSLHIEDYEFFDYKYDDDDDDDGDMHDDAQATNTTKVNECIQVQPRENYFRHAENLDSFERNKTQQQHHEFNEEEMISHELSFSLNMKELEREENMLLDIALPGTKETPNNGKKRLSNNKRKNSKNANQAVQKHMENNGAIPMNSSNVNGKQEQVQKQRHLFELLPSLLPSDFIETCKQQDIIKYIQIPFTKKNETFPIVKEGYLIVCQNNDKQEDHIDRRRYVRVFNNGFIFISHVIQNEDNEEEDREIMVYAIDRETTKCSSNALSNTFYFHIKNAVVTHSNKHGGKYTSSYCGKGGRKDLIFAIDKEQYANYLMEGWKWMTSIDTCIDVSGAIDAFRFDMNREWG